MLFRLWNVLQLYPQNILNCSIDDVTVSYFLFFDYGYGLVLAHPPNPILQWNNNFLSFMNSSFYVLLNCIKWLRNFEVPTFLLKTTTKIRRCTITVARLLWSVSKIAHSRWAKYSLFHCSCGTSHYPHEPKFTKFRLYNRSNKYSDIMSL